MDARDFCAAPPKSRQQFRVQCGLMRTGNFNALSGPKISTPLFALLKQAGSPSF